MFISLPTIQRLTTPIRGSNRIDECRLVPYSGSMVGRICVAAGGGESLLASAFGELPTSAERKFLPTLMRLAVVLAPLLGDLRPHQVDTLLDLLARVPGCV